MEGRYKMKKIIDLIGEELANGFVQAGYDASYGKVTISNRPDLCEYQCNGALAGAKAYKKDTFQGNRRDRAWTCNRTKCSGYASRGDQSIQSAI